MSYKALLFCPDEKTARTVTQVLSDLEFEVQPCNEPFAAVKKLTTEHFDAIVVDCENEQNAVLLFKSARNSASNQASLSIAVVEGQAGVAKAFRIGANLVLTKPINVEQSKGTIRVARGLLRKSESAKAAAPSAVEQPGRPSVAGVPAVSAPAPLSVFELEAEPEAKPEPTEAALLESMPDPAASMSRVSMADAATGKPISQPMATALRDAAEAAGHRETAASLESAVPSSLATLGSGVGAAAAPAKQKPLIAREETYQIEPPIFATSIGQRPSAEAGESRKVVFIAAVILVLAAAGYIGWKKTHFRFSLNLLHKSSAPAQTLRQPQPPAPAAPVPAVPSPVPTAITTPTPPEPSAEISPAPPAPAQEEISTRDEAPAPKPKKAVSRIASSDSDGSAPKAKVASEPSEPAIVVRKGTEKVAVPPPPSEAAPEPSAPGALDVAGDSKNEAIAGLVNVSPSVPRTAPETLKVSQGVSQGLIVKKVAPVYPQQAIQMKIQGAVQLIATISKDGDITNVQLLSGDTILGHAAIDAVKQWKYKPYLLDSQPVEIQTQITVNFKLP